MLHVLDVSVKDGDGGIEDNDALLPITGSAGNEPDPYSFSCSTLELVDAVVILPSSNSS